MTKFEQVIRELDAEELRAALLLAWGILDDDDRARVLDKVRELWRAERQVEDTGRVCALCGAAIRTTAADAQYCPTCGIEHGPMLPADAGDVGDQEHDTGEDTPTGWRWRRDGPPIII